MHLLFKQTVVLHGATQPQLGSLKTRDASLC